MGLGGISMWQLLIVLLIVVLIFGTKRIRSIGGDLGGALKSFRKAMDTDDDQGDTESADPKRIEEGEGQQDAEFAEQKDTSQSS